MSEKAIIIPKIIHYCWFGKNPKSILIQKCMKSWEHYCPGWKIVEWNETNFDININDYVREAYQQGKWAYVSDYARFYVLNKYGGVYLDTDVEVVKPLDELLISKFVGFANDEIVNTGLIMASTSNDWLCSSVLETYTNEHFIWSDPKEILAIGRRVTNILQANGLVKNGEQQQVRDYIVYPSCYFNPTNGDIRYKVDDSAYSVHHYAATWFSTKDRIKNNIRRFIGQKNMNIYYKIKKKLYRR